MFFITISNGLLEGDHHKRMGSAVWEFMWLIDKVTRVDEDGMGWVLGGKPIQLDDIEISKHRINISKNLKKLEKEGYITLRHTPRGIVVKVCKAKKRFSGNAQRFSDKVRSFSENAKPNIRQGNDKIRDKGDAKRHTDPQDQNIALKMIKMIRENIPNIKQPDLGKWAEEINRMRRLDKRSVDDVIKVMHWALHDDFWSTNILSPKKLRKHFDRLTAQMGQQSKIKTKLEGYLHDGTHVVRRGGVWVLATDPGVRVDPSYYPEIAKDQVYPTKELALANKK